MAEFKYQEPFPIQKDSTEYRLLTKDYVKTIEVEGRKILKIQKEGLNYLPVKPIQMFLFIYAPHTCKN